MAERFLHLFIRPKPDTKVEQVEAKLDLAIDWYRYAAGNYILYSNNGPAAWYTRLNALVKNEGLMFICRIDIDERQGWMTTDFWEWLKKRRQKDV